ncbi:MAG: hypothetical protein HYV18_00470 [Gammaproteobacteria bacterium]|nr:hypothetical protein [Gammaproteobacteria bacterium]
MSQSLASSAASLAFLMLALSGPAASAESAKTWSERPECRLLGSIHYRLAKYRDEQAPMEFAASSVSVWVTEKGRTGSHLRHDYSKAVGGIAKFVYAQKELSKHSLGYYGTYSCALNQAHRDNPDRALTGVYLLAQSAPACQQKHGENLAELERCFREEETSIHARLAGNR